MVEIKLVPHADVLVIVDGLHKLRVWMQSGGLECKAIDDAVEMIQRLSWRVDDLETQIKDGSANNG